MTPAIRSAWLKTLLPLAFAMACAMIIGWFTKHLWFAVAVAAMAVVGWHYLQLRAILQHLDARTITRAPLGGGVWNELLRLLARHHTEVRTRKKRLVAMLRAYREAGSALPDAVVIISRKHNEIEWFNDAAKKLLGLEYPRDLGSSLNVHLRHLSDPHWLDPTQDPEPLLDESSPVNSTLHLTLKVIPYSDTARILIARDVTKLMHLEEMRRDFVANVSHELRTPLTVLHGYLDMLDDEPDSENAQMFAEMRQQSQRMNQLVEDLLTLSRLEAQEHGDEDVVSMPFMLSALRREAEALSRGRHKITVTDSAGVDVWGSNKELHSAFSNLVSNAVRYTPVGGDIDIEFIGEDNGAALSVRDSGYGIPAAQIPRITERFYRVSNSRSRETGGTGLGLSIVKHVLNNHDATLEIVSDVGKGSTFTCHLKANRLVPRSSNAVAPA